MKWDKLCTVISPKAISVYLSMAHLFTKDLYTFPRESKPHGRTVIYIHFNFPLHKANAALSRVTEGDDRLMFCELSSQSPLRHLCATDFLCGCDKNADCKETFNGRPTALIVYFICRNGIEKNRFVVFVNIVSYSGFCVLISEKIFFCSIWFFGNKIYINKRGRNIFK